MKIREKIMQNDAKGEETTMKNNDKETKNTDKL